VLRESEAGLSDAGMRSLLFRDACYVQPTVLDRCKTFASGSLQGGLTPAITAYIELTRNDALRINREDRSGITPPETLAYEWAEPREVVEVVAPAECIDDPLGSFAAAGVTCQYGVSFGCDFDIRDFDGRSPPGSLMRWSCPLMCDSCDSYLARLADQAAAAALEAAAAVNSTAIADSDGDVLTLPYGTGANPRGEGVTFDPLVHTDVPPELYNRSPLKVEAAWPAGESLSFHRFHNKFTQTVIEFDRDWLQFIVTALVEIVQQQIEDLIAHFRSFTVGMLAALMVGVVIAVAFGFAPMFKHLTKQIQRTHSMLRTIPQTVLETLPGIQNLLRDQLGNDVSDFEEELR
jgi:hypothetical protein